MAQSIDGYPVLNPSTSLAFLPPNLADQIEASRYLDVATLAALIWDMLVSLPDEYSTIVKNPFRLPGLAYIVARISALTYVTASTIFIVSAVGSCQALQVALGWCYVVAVSAASFLFLLRVRAVFNNYPKVRLAFLLLWMATFGGPITVPFAIGGTHIGPTNKCINTQVKAWSSAGLIISMTNDTLVFLAISWQLATGSSSSETLMARMTAFCAGRGLMNFSRVLLHSGQLYYLATVGWNILTVVMIFVPSVPPVYHAVFTVPNVALTSSMACRVFRQLKLGILDTDGTARTTESSAPRSLRFAIPISLLSTQRRVEASGDDIESGESSPKSVRRSDSRP